MKLPAFRSHHQGWKVLCFLSQIETTWYHGKTICWHPTKFICESSNPLRDVGYMGALMANLCCLQFNCGWPQWGSAIWWWLFLDQTGIKRSEGKYLHFSYLSAFLLIGVYTYSAVVTATAVTYVEPAAFGFLWEPKASDSRKHPGLHHRVWTSKTPRLVD